MAALDMGVRPRGNLAADCTLLAGEASKTERTAKQGNRIKSKSNRQDAKNAREKRRENQSWKDGHCRADQALLIRG